MRYFETFFTVQLIYLNDILRQWKKSILNEYTGKNVQKEILFAYHTVENHF